MSVDYIRVEVPELYPAVMATAGAIAFQCLIIGFSAGGSRKTMFAADKMKEKFGEQHQKDFGKDPPKGGYPDHGDGRYGNAVLSYTDWIKFSLSQRSHKNFLEQVTIVVFLLLTIGFVWPEVALAFGALHFIFRFIFVFGYRKGSKWRMIGGMPINFSLFAMFVIAIVACSIWIYEVYSQ